MEDHHTDTKFLAGLFLGGLIGALVIFFLGTKEGKRAAKAIKIKGEDVLDDLEEKMEDLKEKGMELVDKGEEFKETVLSEIENRKDDLTDDASKRLDNVLSRVEEAQEKGLSTTSALRKRLSFKNTPKK